MSSNNISNSQTLEKSLDFFKSSTFIIISSLILVVLIFLLITYIIYRYLFSFKKMRATDIGKFNKQTRNFIKDYKIEKGEVILSNILVFNKYARDKHSLIPFIYIKNNHLYLLSNFVKTPKNIKDFSLILNKSNYKIAFKNNKNKFKYSNDVNLYWLNEIEKFLTRELNLNNKQRQIAKVVVLQKQLVNIENNTDFYVLAKDKIKTDILTIPTLVLDDLQINNLVKFLNENNIYMKTK
ncbi:hypothetical protein V2E24_00450 [Mycoplasmopsis ciconiae]|uniref:NERD domain-containing protein n=1 Tax=Mycoplasmopsis ciconiae TaxID=561067 RepID=A0ABU7MLI5_9BACT|nr:hypothetical protein [Mycoplasmopsis ciconiae]